MLKKGLNEQFSGIRSMRYRKEIINEIVRIFEDTKSFIELEMSSENERRHYNSFCKLKIFIHKTNNEKQWRSCKTLHFLLYGSAHSTWLSIVSYLPI